MKIQYLGNTCDVSGIEYGGEIAVFFKDGKPFYHHDYSDGALELDYVESLLTAFGIDVHFESIKVKAKQIKDINQYFKDQGLS